MKYKGLRGRCTLHSTGESASSVWAPCACACAFAFAFVGIVVIGVCVIMGARCGCVNA